MCLSCLGPHEGPCPQGGGAPVEVAAPDERTGRLSGNYLFLEPLGRGSYGVVYRGFQVPTRRFVALKLLAPEWMRDPGIKERFTREARITASLHSPYTVIVHDCGQLADDGALFIAMELLTGPTLRSILERERTIEPRRAVRLLDQVAESLEEAHGMGLVHRDLKPENIAVERTPSGEERVKVLDFGIAKILHQGGPKVTQDGLVVGTPYYMSPEQCESGGRVGPASDLYTLGVIAFEMLTGRVPFDGEVPGILADHVFKSPPRLGASMPPGPAVDALEPFVERCLAKRAGARHASASELRAALASVAKQLDDPPPRPAPVAAPPVAPTRTASGLARTYIRGEPPRRIALIAGSAAVAALGAALALRSPSPPSAQAVATPAPAEHAAAAAAATAPTAPTAVEPPRPTPAILAPEEAPPATRPKPPAQVVRAHVRVSRVRVLSGYLPPSAAEQGVRAREPALARCAEPAEGVSVVVLAVQPDGTTASIAARPPGAKAEALVACLSAQKHDLRFPPFEGERSIVSVDLAPR